MAWLVVFWTALAGAAEVPTFTRDIAPILHGHCVECHHPGGAGPFALVTHRDAQKRAKQIAAVTANRQMPPWPPEKQAHRFIGERALEQEEVALLAAWAKAGAPKGRDSDLKVKPKWTEGWALGKPDLVLEMPKAFTLPADGPDVYRNFPIPTGLDGERFVAAVDLRVESSAVHHAFVYLDAAGGARRMEAKEEKPGYPGMSAGRTVTRPNGSFASWQPGKRPMREPEGMGWVLGKGTDLVLQLHMQPTGKVEKVRVSVGLYFTDKAPERERFLLGLRNVEIDIPAGDGAHAVEDAYTLPVDVDVLAVLPHLHFLGREVRGWAELPDGTSQQLIHIRRWNFDWQGDYRYEKPVFLPKGSTVRMRYSFDNTIGNPRNPNQPPKRVRYGLDSADEMAELWLQVLPRAAADLPVLRNHYAQNWGVRDAFKRARAMLERDPRDADSRTTLASVYVQMGRIGDAEKEVRQAIADDADFAPAHLLLSHLHARRNDLDGALAAGQRAVELSPDEAEAQNNLGWFLFCAKRYEEAVVHLEKALAIDPNDALARQNLAKAKAAIAKLRR